MYYREEKKRYYLNVRRSDEEPIALNEEPEHEKKYRLSEEEKEKAQKRTEEFRKSDLSWGKYTSIKPKERADKPKWTDKPKRTETAGTGKSKSNSNFLGLLASFLVLIVGAAGVIYDQIKEENTEEIYSEDTAVEPAYDGENYEEEDVEYEDVDIYEYAPYSLDIAGESFTARLGAGTYRVGQDLPEGIYTAGTDSEWMSLYLTDPENSIYGNWWMDAYDTGEEGEERYQAQDIRLYQGAEVEIGGNGELILATENAQMDKKLAGVRNPLLDEIEEVEIEGETLTAGEDFPEGVYDAEIVSGDYVQLVCESEMEGERWYHLDMEGDYTAAGYRNISLQNGDQIWLDMEFSQEEAEVVLRPAEITYP